MKTILATMFGLLLFTGTSFGQCSGGSCGVSAGMGGYSQPMNYMPQMQQYIEPQVQQPVQYYYVQPQPQPKVQVKKNDLDCVCNCECNGCSCRGKKTVIKTASYSIPVSPVNFSSFNK